MRANETDLNFEENIFIGLGSWPLTIVARLTILSEWNGTQTQNQLVHKRTLNLCSHLNFRYRACFEQGVPWQSGNYRVWIHSERRTWHDKNIQSLHLHLHLLQWFNTWETKDDVIESGLQYSRGETNHIKPGFVICFYFSYKTSDSVLEEIWLCDTKS